MNQPGSPRKKISRPHMALIAQHATSVETQVTAAGQLNKRLLHSAKRCRKPSLGRSQKSAKITAPIGIRISPYSATKSSSRIIRAGKIAAAVVTAPATSVTFQRFQLGEMVWRAMPARYSVGLAVVHEAMTTVTAPVTPAPREAMGPGATSPSAAAHRMPDAIQATKCPRYMPHALKKPYCHRFA